MQGQARQPPRRIQAASPPDLQAISSRWPAKPQIGPHTGALTTVTPRGRELDLSRRTASEMRTSFRTLPNAAPCTRRHLRPIAAHLVDTPVAGGQRRHAASGHHQTIATADQTASAVLDSVPTCAAEAQRRHKPMLERLATTEDRPPALSMPAGAYTRSDLQVVMASRRISRDRAAAYVQAEWTAPFDFGSVLADAARRAT